MQALVYIMQYMRYFFAGSYRNVKSRDMGRILFTFYADLTILRGKHVRLPARRFYWVRHTFVTRNFYRIIG